MFIFQRSSVVEEVISHGAPWISKLRSFQPNPFLLVSLRFVFSKRKLFFKWTRLAFFIYFRFLFKHKFYRINCRLQRDSNSDCWIGRRARWPLDHTTARKRSCLIYEEKYPKVYFCRGHCSDRCRGGQRDYLQTWSLEFESHWSVQFYSFEKKTKTSKKRPIFTSSYLPTTKVSKRCVELKTFIKLY